MKSIYLLLIALVLTLLACQKNESPTDNENPLDEFKSPSKTLDNFYIKHKPQVQKFTIDISKTETITSAKGALITIPANCLRKNDGTPVTDQVEIEFVEIYKQSEMIFSKRHTSSGGRLLESGGQFYLNARAGGEDLLVQPGAFINVISEVPDNNSWETRKLMSMFVGSGEGEDFDWEPADDSTARMNGRNNQQKYYEFITNRLGWLNIDYFVGQGVSNTQVNFRPVAVELEGGVKFSGMVLFKSLNSAIWLAYDEVNEVFSTMTNGLPVGEEVVLIIIGEKDEVFYFGAKEITITDNTVIDISVAPMLEDDIKAQIDSYVP